MTPAWKDKTLFKQPVKKEYHWTVEASGYVDAESYEEAKKMVEDEAEGLVMDDRKYWTIEVGTEPDVILSAEEEERMSRKEVSALYERMFDEGK